MDPPSSLCEEMKSQEGEVINSGSHCKKWNGGLNSRLRADSWLWLLSESSQNLVA